MKSISYILFILVITGAAAIYYFQIDKARELEPQTVKSAPLNTPEDITEEIKHPVPVTQAVIDDSVEKTPEETGMERPLPSLLQSDDRIKEIVSGIYDDELVSQILQQTGIIHRFVLTIDSLPGETVSLKYRLLPPTPGKFQTHKESSNKIFVDPDNFARYDTYTQLLDKMDTIQFVKWYTRFYPLIQEEYDALGYKNRYFNDRFIDVIDHLLETPELTGPIELVQPGVLYDYVDPKMQTLSAGQKILFRIGPENRKAVKAKLIELREGLASPQ
ncbi:DUF3014 domain-containing protein [Kaarinaea lacus]